MSERTFFRGGGGGLETYKKWSETFTFVTFFVRAFVFGEGEGKKS